MNTYKQSIFERIEQTLAENSIKPVDFRKKINLDSQQWTHWRNRGVPAKHHLQVADQLGVNIEWLVNGTGGKYKGTKEASQDYNVIPIIQTIKIPVVGNAQLGDNGHWCEMEYPVGYGDGYINYPSKDTNAYGLRCVGDSMKPRIKNGEFVIVEPNTEYQNGDEVLVKSLDGRVLIKTYLYQREGYIHLHSINEAYQPISIALEQIEKIHYIGAIAKKASWHKSE